MVSICWVRVDALHCSTLVVYQIRKFDKTISWHLATVNTCRYENSCPFCKAVNRNWGGLTLSCLNIYYNLIILAHLAHRAITWPCRCCRSVINFFKYLLKLFWNGWANINQNWSESSRRYLVLKLLLMMPGTEQYGRCQSDLWGNVAIPSIRNKCQLKDTSSLKPLVLRLSCLVVWFIDPVLKNKIPHRYWLTISFK